MVERSVKGDGCEGRRRTAAVDDCSADLGAEGGECTVFACAGEARVGPASAADDDGSASNGGNNDDNAQHERWQGDVGRRRAHGVRVWAQRPPYLEA
jgi:hypothetical protein